jgi:hypothetical protein
MSNGLSRVTQQPYSQTQKLLNDTIQDKSSNPIIFHTHNLDTVKQKQWFKLIEHFPQYQCQWKRDGYYVMYKALLIQEVFNQMGDDDIIYYVDSSAYHRIGFTDSIDTLMTYTEFAGHVCGSYGNSLTNYEGNACGNTAVWKTVWNEIPNVSQYLHHQHVLASWMTFAKNDINNKFINEWVDMMVNGTLYGKPLVTYHHTVDQSIFNILVYKYGMNCFFNNTKHEANKNHNLVHQVLNAENQDITKWFSNPITNYF